MPWTAGTKNPGKGRGRGEERIAVEPDSEQLRDSGNEPLAVAEREDVDERRERGRVHPGDVAADQQKRMPLVALGAPARECPAPASVRRMWTMSISHESDHASRPNSDSGVPVSKVAAGSPSS